MKLSARCQNCNYWLPHHIEGGVDDGGIYCGECRFNPPITLVHSEKNFDPTKDRSIGYFPITKINGWCGKFEKEEG